MTVATDDVSLLVPEGTRIVHIGPHKTGTTSLQSAFHSGRDAVRAQGVRYAGPTTQPVVPVMAVTGITQVIFGSTPPPIGAWNGLVDEIRGAREPRVVVSSEFFCEASPDAIRTIVDDLDRTRVHVVVTLRPLARILASQWQQWVQSGTRTSYDEWLRTLFDTPTAGQGPMFWRRHRHDDLVARWAEGAGPQNVTVIAVDDRDHAMVLRVFERLTGLREGTLATPVDRTNRSLTLAEVEIVRAFNAIGTELAIDKATMAKHMRYGAAAYLKQREPLAGEARIETPLWAHERAAAIQREMVARITASGVRIVGDLEAFAFVPPGSTDDVGADVVITPDIAARAAVGIALTAGLARGTDSRDALPDDPSTDNVPDSATRTPAPSLAIGLDRLATTQIRAVLVRRLKSSVHRRVDNARRRVRRTRRPR